MRTDHRQRPYGYVNKRVRDKDPWFHHGRVDRVNAKDDEPGSSDNVLRGTGLTEQDAPGQKVADCALSPDWLARSPQVPGDSPADVPLSLRNFLRARS